MLLLLTLATVSVCSASPARPHRVAAVITPVDVGNNNDYGGGGGGGGGGGNWGGTDWGTDNHSTSSSSGGDFYPGGLIGGLVVLVVVIFVLKGNKNRGSIPAAQAPSHTPGNHETEIVPAIQAIDPNFSRDSFINWGNEVFITLQQAWTARDWAKIRPFEKEELFRQHEMQLQEYIDTGRINIIGRINIRQAYLHRYQRDAQYEYLTVYMNAAAPIGSPMIPLSIRRRQVWIPEPKNVSGAPPRKSCFSRASCTSFFPSSNDAASGFSE